MLHPQLDIYVMVDILSLEQIRIRIRIQRLKNRERDPVRM